MAIEDNAPEQGATNIIQAQELRTEKLSVISGIDSDIIELGEVVSAIEKQGDISKKSMDQIKKAIQNTSGTKQPVRKQQEEAKAGRKAATVMAEAPIAGVRNKPSRDVKEQTTKEIKAQTSNVVSATSDSVKSIEKEVEPAKANQEAKAVTKAMQGFYRDEKGAIRNSKGQFASKTDARRFELEESGQVSDDENKSQLHKLAQFFKSITNKALNVGESESKEAAEVAAGAAGGGAIFASAMDIINVGKSSVETISKLSETSSKAMSAISGILPKRKKEKEKQVKSGEATQAPKRAEKLEKEKKKAEKAKQKNPVSKQVKKLESEAKDINSGVTKISNQQASKSSDTKSKKESITQKIKIGKKVAVASNAKLIGLVRKNQMRNAADQATMITIDKEIKDELEEFRKEFKESNSVIKDLIAAALMKKLGQFGMDFRKKRKAKKAAKKAKKAQKTQAKQTKPTKQTKAEAAKTKAEAAKTKSTTKPQPKATGTRMTTNPVGSASAPATKPAQSKATKAAIEAAEKPAGKLGIKAAGKTAFRALPVIGTAITAGIDAYQGFSDKEMHQKAFGLREGEEATTAQKTAAAAANILDMGGLVSGGMGLIGGLAESAGITGAKEALTFDTSDIAKNIGDFFGLTKKEEKPPAEGRELDPRLQKKIDAYRDKADKDKERQIEATAPAAAATTITNKTEATNANQLTNNVPTLPAAATESKAPIKPAIGAAAAIAGAAAMPKQKNTIDIQKERESNDGTETGPAKVDAKLEPSVVRVLEEIRDESKELRKIVESQMTPDESGTQKREAIGVPSGFYSEYLSSVAGDKA